MLALVRRLAVLGGIVLAGTMYRSVSTGLRHLLFEISVAR